VEWSGTVAKWSYADDYGLAVDFYRGGRRLGQLTFIWGTALTGQRPGGKFPPELRAELERTGVLSANGAEDIARLLADVAAGALSGAPVRNRSAATLDLAAFAWLAPETCLQVGLESTREEYPDAEDVETA
jgi:hypothetical protein